MWGMIAVESGPYYAFINYIHIDNRVKYIYCLSLYNCQINTEIERMKRYSSPYRHNFKHVLFTFGVNRITTEAKRIK